MAKMLFTPVPRILKDLIMEVENGKLGLPELQRGYVWKATKVRDLLYVINIPAKRRKQFKPGRETWIGKCCSHQ